MLQTEFSARARDMVAGTPCFLLFRFRNVGRTALSFSIGNGREDSFRFRASPEIPTLNPYYEFGGLSAVTEAQPLGSGEVEVLLNRYLHLQAPGQYAIFCELDLQVLDAATHLRTTVNARDRIELLFHEDEKERDRILAALEGDLLRIGPKQMLAADALAELRTAAVVPILERGLRSAVPAVVERMLNGLGNTGGARAKGILQSFLADRHPEGLQRVARQELERVSR